MVSWTTSDVAVHRRHDQCDDIAHGKCHADRILANRVSYGRRRTHPTGEWEQRQLAILHQTVLSVKLLSRSKSPLWVDTRINQRERTRSQDIG